MRMTERSPSSSSFPLFNRRVLPKILLYSTNQSLSQRTTLGALLAREAKRKERRSSLKSSSCNSSGSTSCCCCCNSKDECSCKSCCKSDVSNGKAVKTPLHKNSKFLRFATNLFNDDVCCLVNEYKIDPSIPKEAIWWTSEELDDLYHEEMNLMRRQYRVEYGKTLRLAYDDWHRADNTDTVKLRNCHAVAALSDARGFENKLCPDLNHARKKKHRRAVLLAQDQCPRNNNNSKNNNNNISNSDWIRQTSEIFSAHSRTIATYMAQSDRIAALQQQQSGGNAPIRT